jgi:hypothetical protein
MAQIKMAMSAVYNTKRYTYKNGNPKISGSILFATTYTMGGWVQRNRTRNNTVATAPSRVRGR